MYLTTNTKDLTYNMNLTDLLRCHLPGAVMWFLALISLIILMVYLLSKRAVFIIAWTTVIAIRFLILGQRMDYVDRWQVPQIRRYAIRGAEMLLNSFLSMILQSIHNGHGDSDKTAERCILADNGERRMGCNLKTRRASKLTKKRRRMRTKRRRTINCVEGCFRERQSRTIMEHLTQTLDPIITSV